MSSPLVSVVIPTYLRPALVIRAIRSALAQTVKGIEVMAFNRGRPGPVEVISHVGNFFPPQQSAARAFARMAGRMAGRRFRR